MQVTLSRIVGTDDVVVRVAEEHDSSCPPEEVQFISYRFGPDGQAHTWDVSSMFADWHDPYEARDLATRKFLCSR